MLRLEGTIINVFTQQGGKDKKTGEAFADRDKIQLLGELELPNGDKKHELIDLTVEDAKIYENLKNKRVSIPCGALASGRNVIFYVAKGGTAKVIQGL
ncbi:MULTISPECIES: hypothetical protein [Acinetobacter calcoaceticus/baumannii complex]|jgi:hypothetical protein|uniref:hypothetical protein n=1 Tax=Acinetobacter calcoaceticus/baumannii complex TaxID=909768 RepID=UPI0002D13E31|nr:MULTISPECIES: hypothetical protein [Acinetobacter calcoaceticus/baumannii complex]ENW14352.1 hypothetical protein F930_00101 [Acinetobacter pittii ANC 3678]MDC4140574.1 hypothetical protein [Acinetobacter nosocomialis]